MKKRILSILLAVALVSSNSIAVLAAEVAPEQKVEFGIDELAETRGADQMLNVGETKEITSSAATWRNVTWSSDVNEVATVNKTTQNKANITGNAAGKTTVRATWSQIGGGNDTFKVIVNDSATTKVGETQTLSVLGMTDPVTWASENESIVKVDADGEITGVSVGTTSVTATDTDKDVVTFTITVEPGALQGEAISVAVGASTEKLSTEGLTGTIEWATGDEKIATVADGVVTGVAVGRTTVTATDESGTTKTFEVTVTEAPVEEKDTKVYVMLGSTKKISTEGFDLVAPITWKSADSTIVSVDQSGTVTGNKNLEKTTVTATDANNKVVTFEVHVTELQYFNTNIFDYKEGKPDSVKEEGLKHYDVLTTEGTTYIDTTDPSQFYDVVGESGWGKFTTDKCAACEAGIGVWTEKYNSESVVTYEKGIALHGAPLTTAKVAVPAGATTFTAVAGINQCQLAVSNAGMKFTVTSYGQNNQVIDKYTCEVGSTEAFDARMSIVKVNVTGAAYLQLDISQNAAGEDRDGNDHGVLADAKFTTSDFDQNTRIGKTIYNDDGVKSINDYTYELNNDTAGGLYFTNSPNDHFNKGNYKINGGHNAWTGEKGPVKTGIAQKDLKGSNILFEKTEPGLFTMVPNSAKDVFANVKFPFVLDSDGYYTFDSEQMDAAFKDGEGKNDATLEWYDGSANYSGVSQTDKDNKTGFFPFNDTKGAETYTDKLNFWFGMSQAVDFYMLNGGYMDEPNGKEPIIFEFSGDDDVWIYIDGKLVMDLGGIHDMASGSINFATGDINVTPATGATTKTGNIRKILGSNWGTVDDKDLHSLQIFYLERGRGASNLKVKFNLPQRDQLVVEKAFDNTGANQEEQAELLKKEFIYKVTCDGESFAEKPYVLFEHGAIIDRTLKTDANGEFKLKYGQRAVFTLEMPRPAEHTYQVEERFNESNFTTTWGLKQNSTELGSGEGTTANKVKIGKKEHYNRKNVDVYTYTFHNYRDTILQDDTVVIDYGKKLPINVLKNDGKLYTKRELILDNPTDITNSNGTFEVAKIEGEDNVIFTPKAFLDKIETTNYGVRDAKNEWVTAKVTVIPATTVYYEDDFKDQNNENVIKYDGNWGTEGSSTNDDYQDDGTVGEGNIPYGQDSTYADDNQFSGGSAHWIEGKLLTGADDKPIKDENGKYQYLSKASFEFKGTGFDLISRTDPDCGMITAEIQEKDEAGNYGKATPISVLNKGENTLYQIPVITYDAKEYGTYKVTITVKAASDLMGYKGKFYLDAIRLYNPMGLKADDNTDFSEANDAYNQDYEANAQFISLRDKLITESEQGIGVTLDTSYTDGTVWVDSLGTINDNTDNNTINLETYRTVGPNREVYLSPQCAIAFQLTVDKMPASVQVGAKAPKNGITNWVATSTDNTPNSTGTMIETATDMYYDVTDGINFTKTTDGKFTATVYIANTSDASDVDNILSLTNLKLTYAETASEAVMQSNVTVVREVLACMAAPEDTYVPDYEITSAAFTADKVRVNKETTIVVKTSKDVEELVLTDSKGNVVKPVSVKASLDESLVGTEQNDVAKTWTITVKPKKVGKLTYKIHGVSADGNVSESKVEVSIKVVLFNIKDIFDPWF